MAAAGCNRKTIRLMIITDGVQGMVGWMHSRQLCQSPDVSFRTEQRETGSTLALVCDNVVHRKCFSDYERIKSF